MMTRRREVLMAAPHVRVCMCVCAHVEHLLVPCLPPNPTPIPAFDSLTQTLPHANTDSFIRIRQSYR